MELFDKEQSSKCVVEYCKALCVCLEGFCKVVARLSCPQMLKIISVALFLGKSLLIWQNWYVLSYNYDIIFRFKDGKCKLVIDNFREAPTSQVKRPIELAPNSLEKWCNENSHSFFKYLILRDGNFYPPLGIHLVAVEGACVLRWCEWLYQL